MKKLLITTLAVASALVVSAAEWFSGWGSGGAWTPEAEAMFDNENLVLTGSGEAAFEVTEAKTTADGVLVIESTAALTAYDEVPDATGDKAALAPVDDGETAAYYGLADGKWVKLSGAEPKDDPVTVKIEICKVLGQDRIRYSVDGTALCDWLDTTIADGISEVAYNGIGTVSSLDGSTATPEYLTAANPTISDAAGLAALAKTSKDFGGLAGQTVTLGADIDMSGAEPFAGIGTYDEAGAGADYFAGTFDGNDKTISNITFTDRKYAGIFNQVNGGTIKNLTVENATFVTPTATVGGAMVVGNLFDGTVQNVTTKGSFATTHNAAGVVCRMNKGTVESCTNEAAIATTYTKAAGIVNIIQTKPKDTAGLTATIQNCVNKGAISQTVSTDTNGGVAGILAYAGGNTVLVKDCENTGTLASTLAGCHLGQLIGHGQDGTYTIEGGTVNADSKIVGYKSDKGTANIPHFATVEEGVATVVADTSAVAGANLKVMAAGAAPELELKAGESIAFDTELATIDDTGITAVEGSELTKTTEGNVTTYSVAAAKVYVAEYNGVQYETYADAKAAANGEAVTILADLTIEDADGDANIIIKSGKVVTLKNLKTGANGAANVAWKVAGEERAETKPVVYLTGDSGYGFKSGAKFSNVHVYIGDTNEVWIEADNYMDATVDLEVPADRTAVIVGNVTIGSLSGAGNIGKRAGKLILTKASVFNGNFGSVKIALGDEAMLKIPNTVTAPTFENAAGKILVTNVGESTTIYTVRDAVMFYLNSAKFSSQGGSDVPQYAMTGVTQDGMFVNASGEVITGITQDDTIVIKDTVDLSVRAAMSGYKFAIDNNATVRFALAGDQGVDLCAEGIDVDVKAGSTLVITRAWSNGWTKEGTNIFNIKDTNIHGEGAALVSSTVTVSLDNSTISLPLVGTGTVNAFTGMTLSDDWAGTVLVPSDITAGVNLGQYGKENSTVKLSADFSGHLSLNCNVAGNLDLAGYTMSFTGGYSGESKAYVFGRLTGNGAIASTWEGSTKQYVKINNVLADDGQTIAFTGTLTGVEVILPDGFELDAAGHIVKSSLPPVDPVDPETPKTYDTPEAAAAAAAAINADKANMINAPAGVDKAGYVENFEAVVTEGNTVVVQLTAAAEAAVQKAVDDAQTTVLNPDEEGKATIATKPGFYYGIAAETELDAMATAQPASWTMAEGDSLKLEVTKPSATKGFYRVMSTVKPAAE